MSGIALAIFALVFLVIILGENSPRKLDRPSAALIGAVLMVVCGVLTRHQALDAIDFPTLALLFGMMIVVHYATESGLLQALANKLVHFGKTPSSLLWIVCFASGVLSALFVNDTICLLMTPLLLAVCRRAGLPAEPYLIALATSSNVGSAMTITGNPQNMLIGQSSGWSWTAFAIRMVPIGLVCLVVNGLLVRLVYKREMAAETQIADDNHDDIAFDPKLAIKTVVAIVALLIGFLSGAPMDLVALSAGIALIVWANKPPEHTFATIDWSLLLFFAGLFVVVHGFETTQVAAINKIAPTIMNQTGTAGGVATFSAAVVAASNVFGNVPFVMLIRPWITNAPDPKLLWLLLAMASTFAGNLTLVGSVANLIVANGSKNECPLGFWTFMKVGVPSTIVTVVIGVAMLYAMHGLGL